MPSLLDMRVCNRARNKSSRWRRYIPELRRHGAASGHEVDPRFSRGSTKKRPGSPAEINIYGKFRFVQLGPLNFDREWLPDSLQYLTCGAAEAATSA